MTEIQRGAESIRRDADYELAGRGKRNPPARNTSRFWFERFLAVIQRQNPSVVDSSFLEQIAPSNEGKLLAQLKFLHVIDEGGKPTKLLPMLNMVGDEQKQAFREIAKGSYQDLLSEVKIDKAVPDDLVNFFIRKYSFTRDKGINAARFFLYLTEKGAIQVSPELDSFLTDREVSKQRVSDVPRRTRPPTLSESTSIPKKPEVKGALSRAVIHIHLDKDTPREYWERVLALLGEERQG